MGHAREAPKADQEYAQLLRLNQQALERLEAVASQLGSPAAQALVREVHGRRGDPQKGLREATSAIEQALRALKVWESEIRLALNLQAPGAPELDGVPNLPAPLARFISERQDLPGFSYAVLRDEVRGWIIQWKELTPAGTVRGAGQFYERPYAWLDE